MADLFLSRWAKLYSNQTPAETALEPAVASLGVRYRTQHPMWSLRVFPDFFLPDFKLVIEVDDPGHKRKAQKEKDADRSFKLVKAGYRVVRCTNDEAIADPFGTVDRLMADAGLALRTNKKA